MPVVKNVLTRAEADIIIQRYKRECDAMHSTFLIMKAANIHLLYNRKSWDEFIDKDIEILCAGN